MGETHRRSPEPKRFSALDIIRALDRGYFRADLPRGSAFCRLQDEQQKESKGGVIEYLTPPPFSASVGSIFLESEDWRMLPRPPKQKTSQYKKDMRKYCQYHKDHSHDTDD
ncbi:hypothetical protein LIER_20312 [Lithospermum erythrorhizon]|uniref:Uncharacterized protein n=1 Tax=Lithospermum erythrorhizon TaxID=34254 RepID=A0AAV3QLZ8_LITER